MTKSLRRATPRWRQMVSNHFPAAASAPDRPLGGPVRLGALSSEAQGFNDAAVAVHVLAFDVVEQAATTSHEHQEPAA